MTLRPRAIIVGPGRGDRARELHEEGHRLRFIATSVNFPVTCEPIITT